MKIVFTILILTNLLASAQESDFSYSGILMEKFSITFSSNSLVESVDELKQVIIRDFPKAAGLKFSYIGSDSTVRSGSKLNGIKFKYEDASLYYILDQLAERHRHRIEFRFEEPEIVFKANIYVGSDSRRSFNISKLISEELDLNWNSEQDLLNSLSKIGWIGNLEDVDFKKNSFIAIASDANLKYLDMLIFVKSREKIASEIVADRVK